MRLSYMMLVFILSSCFTQKSIVGKNEPISEQVLMGLRTGKKYHFHFKSNYVCKVKIESINDSTVIGKTKAVYHEKIWRGEYPAKDKVMDSIQREPFVHRYDEIITDTNKITTLKFNPYLTAIPVGFILFTTIYISIEGLDIGGWPDSNGSK